MRRTVPLLLAFLASLLALGGCGQSGEPAGPSDPADTPSPQTRDREPIGLVNLWRVSGAEGAPEATFLRLDKGQFQLWRDDCMVSGSWRAGGETMLLEPSQAGGECGDARKAMQIDWVEQAVSYHATDGGWELRDREHNQVATLGIDGAPEPIESVTEEYTKPPEVTDEVRKEFEPPSPLPSDATPATAEELAGRWVPAGAAIETDPHVVFESAGPWQGSDGCNQMTGRWALGESGDLLATSGPTTMIACDGAPIGQWLTQAATAAIDGSELVLRDRAGEEIARLVKD
ncbi:MAG: META domain-containing protein [Propionibacteriaceae bacterium]